jgi:hypothetical protein
MSFLFEDHTLVKILDESGLLSKLNKYAQDADAQAKLLAQKLADKLANELADHKGTADTEIYVKDLVSLEAYLNYLLKHNKKSDDGHRLVIQGGPGIGGEQLTEADKHLYMSYHGFFVYVSGVAGLVKQLLVESKKMGNEVMKPLVKGLHDEATKSFGEAFNTSDADEDEDGTDADETGDQDETTKSKGFPVTQNTFYAKFKNTKNTKDNKSDPTKGQTSVEQDLAGLRNALPFQSTDSLSPYDMQSFINAFSGLAAKFPNVGDGRLNTESLQFRQAMDGNMAKWNTFINQVATEFPKSNAVSYQNRVPYNLAGRPFTGLTQIFASTPKAEDASRYLLQMVRLVEQTLFSLQRAPDLVALLGKDIISNQVRLSQAFANKLGMNIR